jgi:hypothetical protein
MKTITGRKGPLAMMLEVWKRLWLRHSLPTQLDPAWWGNSALQLSIRLLPLLPRAVDKRRNVSHLALSASKTKEEMCHAWQVIIELPPYRGPQNPLDLAVVEHISGRLFEVFRHVSQAARTGTSASNDA